MTQSHLSACPGCSRHVRVSESACPFCGATLSAAFRAAAAPAATPVGLGRAAVYALGATSLAVAAACSGSVPAPTADAGAGDAQDEAMNAAYGGPPPSAEDAGPGDAAAADMGSPAPLYGAPPMDSGSDG